MERWQHLAPVRGGSRWKRCPDVVGLLGASQITDTLIWRDEPEGVVTVLTPGWLNR